MRPVLVLDGSDAGTGIGWALVDAAGFIPEAGVLAGRDGARLPAVLRDALRAARWRLDGEVLLAVVTGPGSFTGLRATIALAHGLAAGSGAALAGVTAGEAMLPVMRARHGAAACWWVSRARRGRVFIEDGGAPDATARAAMLDALPAPAGGTVVLGGNVATEVAAGLGTSDVRATVSELSTVQPGAVAVAALRRMAAGIPVPAWPLYVDPPEAALPERRSAAAG
ncbi:MAG: tRNA (adenosine(37)-N6)-threonylcarbamoyltransferase complex dimerization subunit type 1 TsaB [Gluconacetobacter diazotrophicus]|nr:tRNA (adenosine(37)-N6)-threonylcarbamoyltransferase complex dimerization subunit type 1 TsaB [Gluconacetobacter diazotrophicus]